MRYLLLLLLTFFSTVHAKEIVTYLHTDLQGSVVMQSNAHGEVVTENKRYAPYGGRLDHQKEEGDVSYISKKFNHDTGLSYLNARYYDPEIGRFLSVDPVDVLQQGGRHFNRYAYAYNSPYQLKDPDGELPFLVPLAVFIVKEAAGEVFETYTGIPAPTLKNVGKTAITVLVKEGNKGVVKGVVKAPKVPKDAGNYRPEGKLPRTKHGNPLPSSDAPHTQLGTKNGRKGDYTQAREFGSDGKLVRDVDFTDHGRPKNHTNPHQHNWVPNPTGGNPQHGPAIPLEMP